MNLVPQQKFARLDPKMLLKRHHLTRREGRYATRIHAAWTRCRARERDREIALRLPVAIEHTAHPAPCPEPLEQIGARAPTEQRSRQDQCPENILFAFIMSLLVQRALKQAPAVETA